MPLVVADRVQETGTANTTVSFTLSGAVTGFQSFAVIGNTNTTYYAATDGSGNWEVGLGTYSTTGPTLTRTTILSSSNSGLAVTFTGTVNVFVTYPAGESVYYQDTGGVVITEAGTADALRVTNTGTGNALVVEDDTNPDSTPFVIDTSGRAIVGNQTAITVRDFNNVVRTPNLQVLGLGGSLSTAYISSFATGSTLPPQIIFGKSSSGVVGTPGVVVSGENLGVLSFSGDDGAQMIRAAQIRADVDGTPGTNDMPGRLVFSTTADGASTPTERMRIDASGNVGIGNTPTQKLDVAGSIKWSGATYENVFTITDGAAVDLNPANGTIQLWTLGASRSPTATNFVAGQSMTLMVNDGAAYTITWPSVTWVGGTAPTLATTGFTVIQLWEVNTTLYGALTGSVA